MRHSPFFICLMMLCGLSSTNVFGQELTVIQLKNPSFEAPPAIGTDSRNPVSGWYDCGKDGETAPDIHPGPRPEDFFYVTKGPFEGTSYLGMVTRSNDSYEAVGQALRQPLLKGKAYSFGLYLAKSERYVSAASSVDTTKYNYDTPVKVRIWGGNGYCRKDELLDESGLIDHTDWRLYQFRLEPQQNHTYLRIEVFWKTPVLIPYRGNVLVDNATAIYEVPIDQPSEPLPGAEPPIVKILNPERSGRKSQDNTFLVEATIKNMDSKKGITFTVNGNSNRFSFDSAKGAFRSNIILTQGENKFRIQATNVRGTHEDEAVVVYTPKAVVAEPKPNPEPPDAKPEYVITPELKNKPKTGQKIKITNLNFQADSSEIKEEAFPALDEFATYLKAHPEVKIEVGGHTNNRCEDNYCNELSERRAKAVAEYLTSKGVAANRITFKGYGKTQPIASNDYDFGRRKNQRVEIKIL